LIPTIGPGKTLFVVEAAPLAAVHDEAVTARVDTPHLRFTRVVLWLGVALGAALVVLAMSGRPAAAETVPAPATPATSAQPAPAPATPPATSPSDDAVQSLAQQAFASAAGTLNLAVDRSLSTTMGALAGLAPALPPGAQPWWHQMTSTPIAVPPIPGSLGLPLPGAAPAFDPGSGTSPAQIDGPSPAHGPGPSAVDAAPGAPRTDTATGPTGPPTGSPHAPSCPSGERTTTVTPTTSQGCLPSSAMPRPEDSAAPGPCPSPSHGDPGRTIPAFPD
jgi:hypothetical protein